MKKFFGKRRVLALSVVAVLAITAAAVAYFTSTGDGSGTASVGSSSAFTVTVSSDNTAALFPGSGSETLTYSVTNPSAGHQNLATTSSSVKADSNGDVTSSGTSVAGCKASWFHAVNHPPTLPQNLAGGATSTSGTVTVTMDDSGTNQDVCQGASPDINVHAG